MVERVDWLRCDSFVHVEKRLKNKKKMVACIEIHDVGNVYTVKAFVKQKEINYNIIFTQLQLYTFMIQNICILL